MESKTIKQKRAEYYQKNKDKWKNNYSNKNKEYKHEWYIKNRERLLEKAKQYQNDNEEKIKKYKSEYCVKKDFKVRQWKKNGLIDNYDYVWDRYEKTENCEMCNIKLTLDKNMTTTRKSMDHCHKTGKFRNIVCHKCNMTRKELYKNSKSRHRGVYLVKDNNRIRWRYKGRRFKTKTECLCYKFICLLRKYINFD